MVGWRPTLDDATALVLGSLLVLAAFTGVAAAKHGTTDTANYTAPTPLYQEEVSLGEEGDPVHVERNVGGASFATGDADRVELAIKDELGLPTGGLVQVYASDGRVLDAEAFCQEGDIDLPAEADELRVWVGSVNSAVGAPLFGGQLPTICPGPGSAGTITAAWS